MEPESVMTDKMREDFEKWAEGEDMPLTQWEIEKHKGDYWNDFTQSAWRAWQACAARTVPEASSSIFASRCPMCSYQHGHQIGCENNPIDIALRAIAQEPNK